MKAPHHFRHLTAILLLSATALLGEAPVKKLAPLLQPFVEDHILAGAVVLVADKDKVLDVEAVGWADISAKKAMRTDAVFWIASQSKPITATALMILVDEGKVNVNDPVEKYLPEFKGQQVNVSEDPAKPQLKAPRHPILVREVLSHTSGLPFKSDIEDPTLDVLSLEQRVKSYAKTPLLFEPGTKSKYANAGINTAGRIVEVVSGMSLEKFLDDRIFKPLGMTDTTFFPSKVQIERLAKSYMPNETKDGLKETPIGQLKYPLDDPERRPMPAGGLFSTANDLSIFYRMMANNGLFNGKRILSEKAVKTMTSDQSGEANSHYGFGFATDGKSFTHGGAYGTNSRYDMERNLVTVYLVQHAGWSGNGKDILHQFQVAATDAYGAKVAATAKAAGPDLVVGINSAPTANASALAETWGAYAIVPASAQAFVLEAVGTGKEGSAISINKPLGSANQKWIITPKGDKWFAIRPSSDASLVLAVAKGETKMGTPMVLEKDSGQPWQLWALNKQENGSYSLTPKHAPGMGLDHLGGKPNPGAKIDLWKHIPKDTHLQWIIKPLTGSTIQPAKDEAVTAKYEPPVIKPEDILPGTTKQFTFTQSKIFPGTTREVTVFIPAQYDGKKPACVYVKTDGYNPREKTLMETLIATREMPVTVGVFVRPGDLPAPMKGTIGRRNRDFEYDGVSDNNVRFLTQELLPQVAKEFSLSLSTDGNDRCMSGGSSGGIAAFAAAWHQPEAFSRVYAVSGSFVGFRGGHEFPTMIRKFEAKPIRAFLTTGTHDMENCAGDWFLLDQEMDKALKFSGYDYQFRIIEGGHGAGYAENYQEAMAYLWKGWPDRVKAGPSAPRAQEILVPNEGWKLLAEGFKSTRGPSCNASGEVFFADTSANKILRIGLDGKVTDFVADSGAAHCVSVGADGRIYTVSEKSGKIMGYDTSGKGSVVMDGFKGHSILAMPDGTLYLTSNTETPSTGSLEIVLSADKPGSVWKVKDGKSELLATGFKFATGMAYRPDQWLLSVAEGHSKWADSYQINHESGQLSNGERFFHLHVADWEDDAGAESLCFSIEGRQFIATKSGIQISADDGPTQVILPVPGGGRVTGVCLGGKDKDTLFAFCGNKIWQRKVQQHAMGAFTPWTKVGGTKL